VDRFQQSGANVEESFVEDDVPADHLPEVVTGGEDGARPCDDDRTDFRVRTKGSEGSDQLLHQLERERVALLRPVQRHARRGPLDREEKGADLGRGAHRHCRVI